MRRAIALTLSALLATGAAAEATSDPLRHLLTTVVLTPDETAAAAPAEGDAKGLAGLQADLRLLADGFESFRDEDQARENIALLEPRMTPALRPFFRSRASGLRTVYRTLAVTDYTWALRFPEPPCAPAAARRALLSAKDGLFEGEDGKASPWLEALLGPGAAGLSAEEALDRASVRVAGSAAAHERLRARARRLTLALASEKATGAARSRLYCQRAAVYEDLAADEAAAGAETLASRASGPDALASVFVVVWKDKSAAATLVKGPDGPVLLTDALAVEETDKPRLFARRVDGSVEEWDATVVRRDATVGLTVLRSEKASTRPALLLADKAPAQDDLVFAIGHPAASGPWTKTSGLVAKAGEDSFQTDAVVAPEMAGGPVLAESGDLAGLLVTRTVTDGGAERAWPVAMSAPALARWLAGGSFATPAAETLEDSGTAAVLTRASARTLTATGLGDWNIPNLPPPPPTPNGVCVSNCGGPSRYSSPTRYTNPSSYSGSSSYASTGGAELGAALGQALAPAVEALIFQGIPALFRGIASLFKGKGGSSTKSAPAVAKKAPPPEPPPKPKVPLKPVGISIAVDKSSVARGDAVLLTATVEFSGDEGTKAGLAVNFTADKDLFEFPAGSIAATNADGRASVEVSVKPDDSKDAHEDLDRETRKQNGEKVESRSKSIPRHGAKPQNRVKAYASNALDSLDNESESSTPGLNTPSAKEDSGVVESGLGVPSAPAVPPSHADVSRQVGARLGATLAANAFIRLKPGHVKFRGVISGA